MAVSKKLIFLILSITILNEVSVGRCELIDHPLVQIIKEVLSKKVISGQCTEALDVFLKKLGGNGDNIWALQMLDATSKVPVGLISYSFGEIGHFYQCTEIEAKQENIKGKYCIGNIAINASVAEVYSAQFHNKNLKHLVSKTGGSVKLVGNPSWSICLPHNCTTEDTIFLMNKSQPFGFGVNSITCQTIEDVYPSLTRDALIGISTLSFLMFVVFLSTSYDLFCQSEKRKGHPGLKAFSLYTNGKQLFQNSKTSSHLTCLDGVRVLSMFWVIILHTWSVYSSGPVFNSKEVVEMSNSILSMVFINGDLACDTFLLVSGILVTYVYFNKYNDHSLKLSTIFRHYFHRIARLTPSLAGVTLVSATLLRYMGSGPNWPYIVNYFEGFCKKYWWSTLLFIQNEFNPNEMCAGHSWYLNVDMQLFLFSPLIFWILSKYTKTGITLLILASLWSICLGFVRAFEEELSGVHPNTYSKTPSYVYMNDYYLKTETRAAPWLMGTILGYLLSKKRFTEKSLPKKITIPMWILTFAVIILCVFGGFSTLRGPEYNKLQNAFYIALVRPSFALTVGWIIWACATNHGGIVNSILSLKIFQLLNKFIYSMYLIHVTSLYMIIFSTKTSLYISFFNLAYWFWGIFMFMFGISIIWVLVFEMPIVVLEKLILPPSDQIEDSMKTKSNKK